MEIMLNESIPYNVKSTAYNARTTAYNCKSTAYINGESTAYNAESTAVLMLKAPNKMPFDHFKGIQQYIFLLFHLEELLTLYVNLFYRFCVTLLFLEIFEQKKAQIS